MSCLFVYGLTEAGAAADLGGLSVDLPAVETEEKVRLLRVGCLAVAVSAVPLEQYSGQRLEVNLEEIGWLEPRVRAHAAVISHLFTHQTVLPMRFGTLFSSERAISEALMPRQGELFAALESARGHEEWTVRVCANPEVHMHRVVAEAELEQAKASRGAQYLMRRRFSLRGLPELTHRLMERAEAGHQQLAKHALHVTPARTELSGLPGGMRSLLSQVYLLLREHRGAFLDDMERLEAELALEGFALIQSGPWPPTPVESICWPVQE